MAEVIIKLDHIYLSLAARPILKDLEWELQRGQRIGLVGPNGAGKSTLLKLVSGELTADSGSVFRLSGLTWGRLQQEPELGGGLTVLQEAMTAIPQVVALEVELDELATQMGLPETYENPARLERAIARQDRLLTTYETLGGLRYEASVKQALVAVGLTEPSWSQLTIELSGGQKKLLMLAKLLVQKPHLLLLDEPDNHLDLPAKRHLERIIQSYDGCVVIISHDRYLLDEVATQIAELDEGKISIYPGNYSAYVTERELRRLRQQQLYAAQQKEIARIEAAIARFELWASLVVNERHIRQARSRRKMLDEMDKVDKVTESRRLTLELGGWRGSNKVIELINLTKVFDNGRTLYEGLNHTIWHGERVGLVGQNGAGKSILLKQIMGLESVTSGEIKLGPSIQAGYYAQEMETLQPDDDLIKCVRDVAPLSRDAAVAFLLRFLFSYDQMQQPVKKLSGGERSRLQLARLVLQRPNLLVLDEPTNNLDIPAIEVLEETLDTFVGTVLVISHDRYFLDRVVDRIVELRDGALVPYLGGYTDYLDERGYEE